VIFAQQKHIELNHLLASELPLVLGLVEHIQAALVTTANTWAYLQGAGYS